MMHRFYIKNIIESRQGGHFRHFRHFSSPQSGMAYVAILILLAILSTLGFAFLFKVGTLTSATETRGTSMQAHYLAEAAANHAMWRLLNDSIQTTSVRVAHDDDDAEENDDGNVDLGRNELELGKKKYVGVRFLNVSIPQGATIINASFEFTAQADHSEHTDVTIFGENADDALRFVGNNYDISNRAQTSASVTWHGIPPWINDHRYRSPNLGGIVKEIVDRPGWASGKAMVILFRSDDLSGYRRAYSYDNTPAKAPLLHVMYSDGSAMIENVYHMHSLAGGRYGYKVRWHTDTTFATIATVGAMGDNVVNQSYVLYVKPKDWYDPSWLYRQKITIVPTVTDIDITDFPYLVKIDDPTNELFVYAQTDGDDILFTASDGTTQLDHEIEKYDSFGNKLFSWVKIPLISSTDPTVIYMYYNDASASNQENPTGVWDNDYMGIWHLKETPTVDASAYDSTNNNNDGAFMGSMTSGDQVPGQIGGSLELDGSNDRIQVSDDGSLDGTNDEGTFELWINWVNAADGDHQIVMSSSNRFTVGAQDGFEWASQGPGNHFFYPWVGNGSNYNLGPNPFTNGVWHHLVVTLKYSSKEVKIYVDSVPMTFTTENVPIFWNTLANPKHWLWGGNPDRATSYFAGKFDEIRVSDIVRSPDWIVACYRNQGSPETYQSIDDPETRSGP